MGGRTRRRRLGTAGRRACLWDLDDRRTGVDGPPVQPFRRVEPHRWELSQGLQVPGTHAPCENGYEIAQVLAWVAAQRTNLAERLRWRGQIRGLMSHLLCIIPP